MVSEKELNKIKDSIEFQMIIEQNSGYKDEYSPLLKEEITLYNEVIRLNDELEKKTKILDELKEWLYKKEKLTFNSWNKGIHEVIHKLEELEKEGND
jgi:hypothetical protein